MEMGFTLDSRDPALRAIVSCEMPLRLAQICAAWRIR